MTHARILSLPSAVSLGTVRLVAVVVLLLALVLGLATGASVLRAKPIVFYSGAVAVSASGGHVTPAKPIIF